MLEEGVLLFPTYSFNSAQICQIIAEKKLFEKKKKKKLVLGHFL